MGMRGWGLSVFVDLNMPTFGLLLCFIFWLPWLVDRTSAHQVHGVVQIGVHGLDAPLDVTELTWRLAM